MEILNEKGESKGNPALLDDFIVTHTMPVI